MRHVCPSCKRSVSGAMLRNKGSAEKPEWVCSSCWVKGGRPYTTMDGFQMKDVYPSGSSVTSEKYK